MRGDATIADRAGGQSDARRRIAAGVFAGAATAVTIAIVLAFAFGGDVPTRRAVRSTRTTTPAQLPGAIPKSASRVTLAGQVSGRYVAQSARCGVRAFRAVGALGSKQVLLVGYLNDNGDTFVQLDAPGGSPLVHVGPGTWSFADNTVRFSSVRLSGRDDARTAVLDGWIHCA